MAELVIVAACGTSMPPTQAASHIAAFPQALVEPCILASSNSGDFVLDPFFGSGTVGLVAKRLHFFGIGTNGLTQYLLAADRGSPELTHFQDALHPAGVAANPACDKDRSPHRKVVGVCGESAFVPDAARILIGLGVNENQSCHSPSLALPGPALAQDHLEDVADPHRQRRRLPLKNQFAHGSRGSNSNLTNRSFPMSITRKKLPLETDRTSSLTAPGRSALRRCCGSRCGRWRWWAAPSSAWGAPAGGGAA
jgi:hypothetical protein